MGLLDLDTHELAFCNAGHENPILIRQSSQFERLATGGMALGVLEEFPYQQDAARMEPGDLLLVYSDGIPDAVNEFDQPFGEERLIACLREGMSEPARAIVQRVIDAVRAHEQGAERIDDLTVIVVKRTA
jgi:serine phosphatase RsbU (regulator of sigma subunit)